MITKNKFIITLISLQIFTHCFYFVQIRSANLSEATCQMAKIAQTSSLVRIINDLNEEFKHLEKVKAKTTYRPKVMVSK